MVRWGGQNNGFGYLHLLRRLGFFLFVFFFVVVVAVVVVVVSSDLGGMFGRVGRGEESD